MKSLIVVGGDKFYVRLKNAKQIPSFFLHFTRVDRSKFIKKITPDRGKLKNVFLFPEKRRKLQFTGDSALVKTIIRFWFQVAPITIDLKQLLIV